MSENIKTPEAVAAAEPVRGMKQKDMQQMNATDKAIKIVVQVMLYLFLGIMAFIVLFPFYYMLITSVKDYFLFHREAVPSLIPTEKWAVLINPEWADAEHKTFEWMQHIDFKNYSDVFAIEDLALARLFINTVYVGLVSTLLSLVVTVLSAFAFARLEFKGKNALFGAMLATMMIPGELFTITNYITVYSLKWNNTFTALIIPFLVSVFYIYLLRQNFMQIPNELYLAAKVDGTTDIKYLWKVMIPLALPSLISITILKMMGAWNSYMWPNLVANDAAHKLITNGLRGATFSSTEGSLPDIPLQMAAVTLVSIPLFLVFIFLRKYIMKGVSRSGIKG